MLRERERSEKREERSEKRKERREKRRERREKREERKKTVTLVEVGVRYFSVLLC